MNEPELQKWRNLTYVKSLNELITTGKIRYVIKITKIIVNYFIIK